MKHEQFTIEMLEDRLRALPASVVYGQLTGREDWGAAMNRMIPIHMHEGLVRWIGYGREDMLGGFMRAFLENDLMRAIGRADDSNQAALVDWAGFLYNYAPQGCYGGVHQVEVWGGMCVAEEDA